MCSNSRSPVICAVCSGSTFSDPFSVRCGGWTTSGSTALSRHWTTIEIGRCDTCGHVQAVTPLTPQEVAAMYAPQMWDRGSLTLESFIGRGKGFHDEMFSFCQPEMFSDVGSIADIGTGSGRTIAALCGAYGIPLERVVAIDFSDCPIPSEFCFIRADINLIASYDGCIPDLPEPIGFAFCRSVFEHVLEPRAVLRLIGRHLCDDGYLYIDVPDATKSGSPGRVGDVPLIHPHHLQYFSAEALTALALTSGFEVVRLLRSEGPGYPRLMALLRRAAPNLTSTAIKASTVLIKRRISEAAAKIQRLAEQNGGVCIWGVGAEFETLLETSPDLRCLVADRKAIRLYDGEWDGYTVHGARIEDPSRLSDAGPVGSGYASPIVITPLSIPTRTAMSDYARERGFAGRVVDPYK